MAKPLTDEQVQEALSELPGWEHRDNKIMKTYKLGTFKNALSFIVRLGLDAEEQQHHPEIHNVYASVRVALCTHDAGDRVTEKDIKLAKAIKAFAGE